MGNCKDCKWWVRNADEGDHLRDANHGPCGKISALIVERDESLPMAFIEGDGVGYVVLGTHADFGCTLFEPNEQYQYLMDNQPALYRQTRRNNLRVRASMGYADAIETLRVEFGQRVDEA